MLSIFNVYTETVEILLVYLIVSEETKSTFSVEMSYDNFYQWLLQKKLDEEDCQLLKGNYYSITVFSFVRETFLISY